MSDTIQVTVVIENMTIGDLELLDKAGRNELPTAELIEFLDRIVEEDVRTLPITALPVITQALGDAVAGASNPSVGEGPEGN